MLHPLLGSASHGARYRVRTTQFKCKAKEQLLDRKLMPHHMGVRGHGGTGARGYGYGGTGVAHGARYICSDVCVYVVSMVTEQQISPSPTVRNTP